MIKLFRRKAMSLELTQEEIIYLKVILAGEAQKYSATKIDFKPNPLDIIKKLDEMAKTSPSSTPPLVNIDQTDPMDEYVRATTMTFSRSGKNLQTLNLTKGNQLTVDEISFLLDKDCVKRLKLTI
jgi:hypothetical protein